MNRRYPILIGVVMAVVLYGMTAYGQTGKITGQIIDAESGDPLPGVNVVIDGTNQGTASGADGYYTILNVSPGTYTLRATFVGYTETVVEDVEVNVDLTTTVNIQMQEEAVGLKEVTVEAEEPPVRPDISANVANLSSQDIQDVPVSSVEDMIGLQAGVRGLSVRGGDLSSLQFRVDGASSFDGRANQPFTSVSLTSIEQVQVQTGGFNAEYGNVRSGLINVVTKEGPRNRYTADALVRYSPPNRDYFNRSPNAGVDGEVPPEEMGYFVRPYMDPEVAFVGTHSEESPWDQYTRRQYIEWQGFNRLAESREEDLSPEQWQQVYQHYHRKDFEITTPDYLIDGSFGGPVPGVSDYLGNLRFFTSYRQTQSAYIIPMWRNAHEDYLGRLRLTADISPGLKLDLRGMLSKEYGHGTSFSAGSPGIFPGAREGTNMVDRTLLHSRKISKGQMFGDVAWPLKDIERQMFGGTLTHTLGSNTFYRVQLDRIYTDYLDHASPLRDKETCVRTIESFCLTEAPFKLDRDQSAITPTKQALGGYYQRASDSSWARRWEGRIDITSQIDRWNQVKAGVNIIHTDHRRLSTRIMTEIGNQVYRDYLRSITQAAAYLQDKLEFEGMIANVGLRLNYYKPIGDWFVHDFFDPAFATAAEEGLPLNEVLNQEPIEAQLSLSPRLGVSFPITTQSKLFFNYGHFREPHDANSVFRLHRDLSDQISFIANPGLPLSKTVSYELGYEHSLYNQFLIRLTGYYKDLKKQPRSVSVEGAAGNISYTTQLPYHYEDIRGVEAEVRRPTGNIRGWVNYTFMASKSGFFGLGTYHESRTERLAYLRRYRNREHTPEPRPYARANVTFLAPRQFGPSLGGGYPLANFRLSFLGSWQAGNEFTWCGGTGDCPEGVRNNVQWKDAFDMQARISKTFSTRAGEIMVYADMDNVLNIKRLNRSSFIDFQDDWEHYMNSLHLPKNTFEDLGRAPYRFIPGDDRPGDFRESDVEFVPIEPVKSFDEIPELSERALYYLYDDNIENGTYYEVVDGQPREAPSDEVDRVLESNAYIDMPNLRAFHFLHPRQVWLGLRFTF
jgi:hypothetical protein